MQILCKYKDYYDYTCHLYGRDPFPTYDRRECFPFTQQDLIRWIVDIESYPEYFFRVRKDEKEYFCLETGSVKYIFEVSNFSQKKKNEILYDYSADFRLCRTVFNLPKTYKSPIALGKVDMAYTNYHLFWKNKNTVETCDERELDFSSKRYFYRSKSSEQHLIQNPILAETEIPRFINPMDIYKNLDNYLRSQYNDKNQQSEGLTDIERAINKGFNGKESFRNIHPRN